MPKSRTKFVCQQCGAETAKWVGRCPDCGAWNSMVETVEQVIAPPSSLSGTSARARASVARSLTSIGVGETPRIRVPMEEFDRVVGGGIVPGSLVLIGGDPGIGKSTLLLQICGLLGEAREKVLYVAAEESAQQLKLRAERLRINAESIFVLAETNVEAIVQTVDDLQPRAVVVDSIQTVATDELGSSPGSVSQVRDCTLRFMQVAKSRQVSFMLVGHVTKEGAIAGPRVLEHIVDAVLYLEGERYSNYRLLRSVKNRFGSTDEVGMFEMADEGLREVENGAALFLGEPHVLAPGAVVAVPLEGTRPLLVEVQALASHTTFGLPRRTANGFDVNRLHMLLAVLTKQAGLHLGSQDVYVNVVGGLRVTEPAVDLAVALAVASSYRDQPVPRDIAAIGEVGLAGEVRPVRQLDRRVAEAGRLGFRACLVPPARRRASGSRVAPLPSGVDQREAESLGAAIEMALGPAPRRRIRRAHAEEIGERAHDPRRGTLDSGDSAPPSSMGEEDDVGASTLP